MYHLTVEESFSAAHQLNGYQGKCERLHGHNWLIEAVVGGEHLDDIGLLVDFHILKKELKIVLEKLDHSFINEVEPFDKINPSSENIAKFIADRLNITLQKINPSVKVISITVWESATNRCTYLP